MSGWLRAPPWWRWPSWVVEIPTGIGLQGGLHLWGPHHAAWQYVAAGLAISGIYELWLDRHVWSWRDVLQRAVGQVVGELPWAIL